MKKVLLGTSALVAASVIATGAAKAEVSLNMWSYTAYGFAIDGDDQASDPGLVSYQNANIDFKGTTELDNGMTVSMVVDMYAHGGSSSVDEMRVAISDDWGTIDIGNNDSAADLMNGVQWVTGNGVNSGTWTGYAAQITDSVAFMRTASSFTGDAQGIRYFTPTMNGFRAAVSYQGDSSDAAFSNIDSAAGNYNNVVSVGVEYSGDMDGVGISLNAGADHALSYTHVTATSAGADDEATQYFLRGGISTGGFFVGAAYAQMDFNTSSTAKRDRWTFAATASYSTGPHTIGIEYATAEQDTTINTAGDDQEAEGFLIGYNNNLGNGVYWDARYVMIENDESGTANDADISVFETGLGVSF
ncbi:MAG: porin [Rhodospirillales bacterium]